MIGFRSAALAAGILAALLSAGPVSAQGSPPDPTSPSIVAQQGAPMPANVAELDKALAARDYETLNRIHDAIRTGDDLLLLMNWEQVRAFEGAGLYVTTLYMTDLWNMASAVAANDPGSAEQASEMKQTSVFMGLYSYELISLDGARCADASAPAERLKQLIGRQSQIWAYAAEIPPELREKMVGYAMLLESATASRRKEDDVLCRSPSRGGMAEMLEALAASAKSGKAPQEVPPGPGVVGKTYVLAPPPLGPEAYVGEAVWRPRQAKLREGMRVELNNLIKLPAPAKP